MSIELIIEGDQRVLDLLEMIIKKASSSRHWQRKLIEVMEVGRRYAVSISPRATGSYAGAHRSAVVNMGASIFVNPDATNIATGQRVIRYAAAIEKRDRVYERTRDHVRRLVSDMEVL